MNLRYQETFCIIFILCTSITLGEDFDFVPETNDDVEPIAAEPTKLDSQTKLIHPKVTGRCLPTESTIKLSLGLKSKNWKHVQASLKQRTITKLAEYFLVPEESIIVHNAKSAELQRMVEKALHHGKKPPQSGKSLGWIGFPVGCGEKMSTSAKETVRNLNTQLANIRDLTGMDFGWWVIWKDHPKQDARVKRDVDIYDDYNYDDYEDEETVDDDEGETTEVPHAHRHHHGSSETTTTTTQRTVSSFTTPKQDNAVDEKEVEYENYDDEYDDEEEEDSGRDSEVTTIVPVSEPRNVPSTTERVVPVSTEPATLPVTTTPEATTTTTTTTSTTTTTTTTTPEPTTTTSTTEAPTTTTTTEAPTTTTTTTTTSTTTTTMATTELDEPTNLPPIIRNRIPKQAIIAGKVYV